MAAPICPLPSLGRSPGTMVAASPPASSIQDGQPGKALPSTRQGRREDVSPLRAGKLAREDISPSQENVAYERSLGTYPEGQTSRHVVSESHEDLPYHPQEIAWRTRAGSPLQRTCRRHHYRGRHSNDEQDQLIEYHRRSTPGRVKDSSRPSPVGLRHRPKSSDICHACNLATVVSPWV
jgi:hypothetical protein